MPTPLAVQDVPLEHTIIKLGLLTVLCVMLEPMFLFLQIILLYVPRVGMEHIQTLQRQSVLLVLLGPMLLQCTAPNAGHVKLGHILLLQGPALQLTARHVPLEHFLLVLQQPQQLTALLVLLGHILL